MTFNRRLFLSVLLTPTARQTTSIQVAVLETFNAGQGVSAVLVHQDNAAARDTFAKWLRAHTNGVIRVRTTDGWDASATMFRVRMCFGRGLILFEKPIPIREGDVLYIA